MEYIEVSGKTVDDAITEACQKLTVTSDRLDYEVIEKGTSGFLGFAAKDAVIRARVKDENAVKEESKKKEVKKEETKEAAKKDITDKDTNRGEKTTVSASEANDPKEFLTQVFNAMGMEVEIKIEKNEEEISIELSGPDMGVLIGKRGQTLDSLQYLTSLVVNKGTSGYTRVKVDTENYRTRRKETLDNLAKNLAYKVKRTKRPVTLEPMNPYERRVIHSALQNDKYVSTHSEGEEPYRRVVITLNK